jgi:hypothetical protein
MPHDVGEVLAELHELVERHVPPSRERSLALTKLEEAEMWLTRAAHAVPPREPVT